MNIKFLTTAEPENAGWKQLERSLLAGGVPYHLVRDPWTGFGGKISGVRNYLLGEGFDVDIVVFADGVDNFFLGSWDELVDKILDSNIYDGRGLFSAEKAVWPPSAVLPRVYPSHGTPWNYLNSGGYVIGRHQFLEMTEGYDFTKLECDQSFFTACYLDNPFCDPAHGAMRRIKAQVDALGKNIKADIVLDAQCRIFQSIAFAEWGGERPDFLIAELDGRLINWVTGTMPNFIHGNGRTPLEKIYALR